MHIEKSSLMGFCSGVKRAVTILEREARERGPLQTLGPAVHNRLVVERLASLGVGVAAGPDEITGDRAAIPSHGAAPQVLDDLKSKGVGLVDATCPIVHKAQLAAEKLGKAGFFVVVFGDAGHPEVKGLLGWAGSRSLAARDVSALSRLEKWPRKIGILCQTTQSADDFRQFVKAILDLAGDRFAEVRIINTVCNVTHRQQEAAGKLAARVDLVLVVGGKTSSNARRLAERCQAGGVETRQIEEAGEIDPEWLRGKKRIGITAGASTPDWSVDEVIARVMELIQRQ
ncbi:MAG: 4-hydroxy-3-methylbut-2-enyl diphosphate reductase [Chloroflexi bacterium]|nr:4-hydroxy-3-methylbut-2-enyl diphosphate reductase [Chloroflexota bacterium]